MVDLFLTTFKMSHSTLFLLAWLLRSQIYYYYIYLLLYIILLYYILYTFYIYYIIYIYIIYYYYTYSSVRQVVFFPLATFITFDFL